MMDDRRRASRKSVAWTLAFSQPDDRTPTYGYGASFLRMPPSQLKPTTEVKQPASCLLEPEDHTLVAWYRSLYAPRTGGAHDSHHRTAEIAGRTQRRGGVAAGGAGAAAGDAGRRLREQWVIRCFLEQCLP